MHLIAVGISHHTAPVALRERFALPEEQHPAALEALRRAPGMAEASILSTCNRTELLVAVTDVQATAPVEWFRDRGAALAAALEPHLTVQRDQDAARHLFRVAGGLDSLVVGEPQILGQVKDAYRRARLAGTAGRVLSRVYEQAFGVAKRIRTDTAIGSSPVSIAYAAATLARQIFGDLRARTLLVVGAGDTAELALKHLRSAGVGQVLIANRTLARAQRLATLYGGEAVPLSALPEVLHRADVVVSSTHAELPILGKGAVERALRERRRQPMFLVDLAVPRDIEPEVGSLPDVYLYTVDDLRGVADDGLRARQAAVTQAEHLIDAEVETFSRWCNAQQAVPALKALHDAMGRLRDRELDRALADLARGQSPEQVVRRLAHQLTSKVAHAPSARLRAAGQAGDAAAVAELRRLLGLDAE